MGDLLLILVLLAVVVLIAVSLVMRAKGVKQVHIPGADPLDNGPSLSIGGGLSGHKVRVDGEFFVWKHPYGHGFKVPRSAVQTVLVQKTSWGKSILKVVGAGTELATVPDLPQSWAEQAQTWMLQQLAN